MIAAEKSMPVLTTSIGISLKTASSCCATKGRGNPVNGADTQGVLGGEGGQDRRRIPSQEGYGLYVGLDSGAAAGIAAGHGQDRTARERLAPVEEKRQFGGSQARFWARQHRRDDGNGVGSGVDNRPGVVPVDAADGDNGDATSCFARLGKCRRSRKIPDILASVGYMAPKPI